MIKHSPNITDTKFIGNNNGTYNKSSIIGSEPDINELNRILDIKSLNKIRVSDLVSKINDDAN